VVRPAQHDEAWSAIQMEGSSSEDVLALDDIGDERHPQDQSGQVHKDHQKHLQRQSLTSRYKQADPLFENRAFQEECAPGATDGSMPVSSGSIIYSTF
jgi:hypothetical protein